MCHFLSVIVLRNGDVLHHPLLDSHSDLVTYFKLPDGAAHHQHFAKAELTPPDDTDASWCDASTWRWHIDEPTRPGWLDDVEAQAEAKARAIAQGMVLPEGHHPLLLDGAYIIPEKRSVGRILGGRLLRLCGGTVSEIWGGTVSAIRGGTVSAIRGGTVSEIWGGTVSAIRGGTVSEIWGGTVSAIQGGTVSAIWGGTVSAIQGGTVSAIQGGTVSAIWGGTVSAIWGGTVSAIWGGYAPIFLPKRDDIGKGVALGASAEDYYATLKASATATKTRTRTKATPRAKKARA